MDEYVCDAYPVPFLVSEKPSSPEDQWFNVDIKYTKSNVLNARKLVTSEETYYYRFKNISKDEMMQETTILGWLSSIRVPSDAHQFMVAKILECARRMVLFTHKENRVLKMCVEIMITKVCDDTDNDNYTDDSDDDDDDYDDDEEILFDPASNSSIEEGLKTINEEERCVRREICSICFDDIEIVNVQMPCLHKFHRNCIVDWLKISGVCPLCRSQL